MTRPTPVTASPISWLRLRGSEHWVGDRRLVMAILVSPTFWGPGSREVPIPVVLQLEPHWHGSGGVAS
jgi:hypothetical protein